VLVTKQADGALLHQQSTAKYYYLPFQRLPSLSCSPHEEAGAACHTEQHAVSSPDLAQFLRDIVSQLLNLFFWGVLSQSLGQTGLIHGLRDGAGNELIRTTF
jgi:hypothetical protein